MSVIESYKLGTPVIGASIGGIPEIIESGKTGFVFQSGDSEQLTEVLNYTSKMSDDSYKEMQYLCKKFAELNFSENHYYEKLLTIYNITIQKSNKKKI